jgi:glycosyltransferase involved in cell wall biosynthesis
MSAPPTVSVVIPTYNRALELERCLGAIARQTLGHDAFEVIVVDDGSSDHTSDLLAQWQTEAATDLRWLQQEHRGPAAARNLGIGESKAALIAFTDDDCVADDDWLEVLVGALPDDPCCAGLGGPIRGISQNTISRFIDRTRLMSHWASDGRAEYLITANALFRASCLRAVGGFNADFPLAGGEDSELSFRLRGAGHYLAVIEDRGVIRHRHHDSLRGFWRMCWRHGYGACMIGELGFIDPVDTTVVSAVKQVVRASLSSPPDGARSLGESIAWRGLEAAHRAAKWYGGYAWRRRAR